VKALAILALCAVLLAGCGGSGGDKAVAHVNGDAITRDELDVVVDHFRTKAQSEGKSFPEEGTAAFEQTRNQLLGLLVYRTELRQAAHRLGVEVGPDEIGKRLAATGAGQEEGSKPDEFARDAVEVQLLTERISAKVTRGVTGATPAETAARKNQKLRTFLARLQRETKVSYEPGYAPGS
jgi:hypothetical protein